MDKSTIISQISEQDIFFKFLNISAFPAGNISSPFSDDKNPSFKLYKNNTFKCNFVGAYTNILRLAPPTLMVVICAFELKESKNTPTVMINFRVNIFFILLIINL